MTEKETGELAELLALAERVRLANAAPAMLAALQLIVAERGHGGTLDGTPELAAAESAIALATGAPTGEQAPPLDMHGKRTDTWNLSPGAQPDDGES